VHWLLHFIFLRGKMVLVMLFAPSFPSAELAWRYPSLHLRQEKKLINTLTLNPALDRILHIDGFVRNITNRVQKSQTVMGGKGTHVSINLRCLGMPNRAFGVCHGATGQRVVKMLAKAGVETRFVQRIENGAETRTNYLIVERSGDCSIIADQGAPLREEDWRDLLELMDHDIMTGDCLVLSGDFSNSPAINIYDRLFARFRERGLKVFVDTSGPSLKRCVAESPYMIKPNLDELSTLCSKAIPLDDDAIMEAVHSLAKCNIPVVAVSLGSEGSLVRADGAFYRIRPPKVAVANTIGCGDSFLAGFVYGFAKGLPFERVLRIATAISAATAESDSSVGFDPIRAEELEGLVAVRRL
jgi:1-phosphofructokinase family hexose kinase